MIADDLTKMLEAAMVVTDNGVIDEATSKAAEDCAQSLLKSMAVLGYDTVKRENNNG